VKVAALGGGHGLSAVIKALRLLTSEITAIVTVADDGGSSGRLVSDLGILPPGDARRCLLALSDEGELVDLFSYRFRGGTLDGHSLGNLILAALIDLDGSFQEALRHAGNLLQADGQVVPASTQAVRLVAEVNAVRVEGQSRIARMSGIQSVALEPADPPADPEAVQAILAADMVVFGPGSLFTSVLPVLSVPGILQALSECRAMRVFVCNLTAEAGETYGMSAFQHLEALLDHTGDCIVDAMLVNELSAPHESWISPPAEKTIRGVRVFAAPLASRVGAVHDPVLLASFLQQVFWSFLGRDPHANQSFKTSQYPQKL